MSELACAHTLFLALMHVKNHTACKTIQTHMCSHTITHTAVITGGHSFAMKRLNAQQSLAGYMSEQVWSD